MPIMDGLRSIFRREPRDPGLEAAGKVGSTGIAPSRPGILQPGGFGYELLRGFAPGTTGRYEAAQQQRLENERAAERDRQIAEQHALSQETGKTQLANVGEDRRRAAGLRGVAALQAQGGDFGQNLERLAQAYPQLYTPEELEVGRVGGADALHALLQDVPTASGRSTLPAAIQEHQYFQGLDDTQKRAYLNLQRGDRMGTAQVTPEGLIIPVLRSDGTTDYINLGDPEAVGNARAAVSSREEAGKRLGENVANDLQERLGEAQQAAGLLVQSERAQALLDEGIISGPLANQRLALARVVGTITGEQAPETDNTDEYIALVNGFTGQAIKAFGSGTGLSDADRDFARAMSGGNLEAAASALQRIVQVVEQQSNRTITNYNERRTRIGRTTAEALDLYPEVTVPGREAPTDFSGMSDAEADEAYANLPSGATFTGPDGNQYTKP